MCAGVTESLVRPPRCSMDEKRFPEIIREVYRLVAELEAMFPGRHFTPDGHMVGSIGEAIAKYYYGVELFSASHKGHDGKKNSRLIQIKATQGKSISSEPQFVLAFRLRENGTFEEVYNGPGGAVWALVAHRKKQKNSQLKVGLPSLRRLMKNVQQEQRFVRVRA